MLKQDTIIANPLKKTRIEKQKQIKTDWNINPSLL